ncbi:MAG: hypothetical protein U0L65_06490 [Bacteroidales bacterium]|nr:hypothetical protein [Bacteroidales bacterium]
MKKLLGLILVISLLTIFSSCESIFETEYTISSSYNIGDIQIYEYNEDNEKVSSKTAYMLKGYSRTFTAVSSAEKVKIYCEDYGKWVQQVYYLDDDTEIRLSGETIIGNYEP